MRIFIGIPLRVLPAAAVAALSALVVAASGQAATAATQHPANPVNQAMHGQAEVSGEAWAAGRAIHGDKVTAAQAIEAFWTPERMRASKPIEQLPEYQAALGRHERNVEAEKSRARSAPEQPAPPAAPQRFAPYSGALGTPDLAPDAVDPGYVYWHPTARTSGKVFFTVGGSLGSCSGTIVNSEGQNSVWTAGHCVHGGQGSTWFGNWTFVPAYDDDLPNPRPYGTWSAVRLTTMTSWINNSDFTSDLAVATMAPLNGNRIVAFLGGQGIIVDVGRRVYERAFGYPSEPPFDGGNLYRCEGTSAPEWEFLWAWSETIQIPCDMNRGASGGGWLFNWDGNWGWLNGVNSRVDRLPGPTVIRTSYFDNTAWTLFNDTRHL